MDGLLAGIDLGTTRVKVVVATQDGQVVARLVDDIPTATGPAGEMEQDPSAWWQSLRTCLLGFDRSQDIVTIGLTGQMQDVVPTVGARPLRRAMLYSDVRAREQFDRLRQLLPTWEQLTANQQDVSSVPAKLGWLAQHEPRTLQNAQHVLLGSPGYVMLRMTGRSVLDPVTASTTGLLDVGARSWSAEVLQACGVAPAQLPELADVAVGELSEAAARDLGLRAGIPVVHAMGDAGAATDGLVGSQPGQAYINLGTTGWVAGVVDALPGAPSGTHQLVMPGWASTLRIGAVLSAGATAEWARHSFFEEFSFEDLDAVLADRVGSLDNRPLCLPGLGGERTPVRDDALRGTFVGITRRSDPGDLYLAALTGVAMGLRHAADDLGWRQERILVAGGGATSRVWRQILADIFEAAVVTGELTDPGAWSAIRAAARAVDGSVPLPLGESLQQSDVVEPGLASRFYEDQIEAHRALYDAVAPICRDLF
ncbi:FGGY family carbohydrate kinase [Luteococcus sp. Sow4_B9]|uniref:FGGY family carbohydrate kinase n=1 Tax=Luteococcus sp. Sow4_B9 TaxID=3438792 RepID=UPI003F96F680